MLASVYIESSVISYLTARPSRDVVTAARQAITLDWWHNQRYKYEVYISALVEEEITLTTQKPSHLLQKSLKQVAISAPFSVHQKN